MSRIARRRAEEKRANTLFVRGRRDEVGGRERGPARRGAAQKSLSVAVISLHRVMRERLTNAQARRVALAAQGFGVPRPDRAITIRDVQAVDHPAGPVPDRLDQRRHPGALRAAVLPARRRTTPALLERAAHRAAAPAVRVLGARGEPARRDPAADAPVPDAGRLPRRLGGGGAGGPGAARPGRARPAAGGRARAGQRAAARGRRGARPQPVGLELVGGQDGAGVAVLLRRGRRRPGATASSSGSTTCPSGCCRRPCWPRRRRPRRSRWSGSSRRAAQALGVASELSLRDYFRTRPAMTRQAVAELVEDGELLPVAVPAWEGRPLLPVAQARVPRRVAARALLSPFDSMVFERARLDQLFDFLLPHRDLRAAGEAGARLLRLSVPARRRLRRPGRPQGRPGRRGAAGATRPGWSPGRTPP